MYLSKFQNVFLEIAKCICLDFCQESKILGLKPSGEIHYCCQSLSQKFQMYLLKLQNVFVEIVKCICPDFCQETKISGLKPNVIHYCCQSSSSKTLRRRRTDGARKGVWVHLLSFTFLIISMRGGRGLQMEWKKSSGQSVYLCIFVFVYLSGKISVVILWATKTGLAC